MASLRTLLSIHLMPPAKPMQSKYDNALYCDWCINGWRVRHPSSNMSAKPRVAGVGSLSRSHIKPTSRLSRGLVSGNAVKSLPSSPRIAPVGTTAIPTPARTKLIIVAN